MTIHGMLKCGFIDPGSGSDIRESSISVLVFYEDHYLHIGIPFQLKLPRKNNLALMKMVFGATFLQNPE